MKLCNFGEDLNADYAFEIWFKDFQFLKNNVQKTLEV